MAKNNRSEQPPRRKEPGLLAKSVSWFVGGIYWLFISLVVSILIEWVGIAFFWPEQGSQHSAEVLRQDYRYLNQRVTQEASNIVSTIGDMTRKASTWVDENASIKRWLNETTERQGSGLRQWVKGVYQQFGPYIDAVPNTTQVFFVRIAILILSMPAFFLFGVLGVVDGFVERDLRRWGGGRESSVIYNIARKSLARLFIATCVIYLSFPVSIEPSWIIIPFAMAFGLSVRVAVEKFKKYF